MTAPSPTAPNPTASNPTAPDSSADADRRCAACRHPWNTHDAISARFCAATVVGGYDRGCVCVTTDTPGDAGSSASA